MRVNMTNLEMYQDTIQLLWQQRIKVSQMNTDKQNKYLPKIDKWIVEISEAIEQELQEVG